MVRPRETEEYKAMTSIYINRDVLENAKKMGLNISEISERALATAVNLPETKKKFTLREKFKQMPKERIKRMKAILKETGDYDKFVGIVKKKYNIDTTKDELIEFCNV